MKRLVLGICCLLPLAASTVLRAAEETIDIDAMSAAQLREEIDKIEKEVYRVFNLRTEDESLHVTCHRFTPTGSNIPREACEPNFLIEARAQNASDYQNGFDELLDGDGLRANTNSDFERFTAAMEALNEDYDYFRELNIILVVLRQRLEEIR